MAAALDYPILHEYSQAVSFLEAHRRTSVPTNGQFIDLAVHGPTLCTLLEHIYPGHQWASNDPQTARIYRKTFSYATTLVTTLDPEGRGMAGARDTLDRRIIPELEKKGICFRVSGIDEDDDSFPGCPRYHFTQLQFPLRKAS